MSTLVEETEVLLTEEVTLEGPIEALAPFPELLVIDPPEPFRYCLNTSTLRGHRLGLDALVDIAAAAGYDAIEPWVDELDRYEAEGRSLKDLGARLRDLGITVESAIGFFNWIGDDRTAREAGLTEARRSMSAVARIGGRRIAAPAFGAHESSAPRIDLLAAAERYRALLEVGAFAGVVPMVEVWGFSKNLTRLGEAALIAVEAGHPDASILADVYHLYKGGSPVAGLRPLSGAVLGLFHVNDYPDIPRAQIADRDRVYPGDGIAPLTETFQTLREIGYRGALSLELFNESYWREDPALVARTGLEKLKAAVARSLEE